jgi:hypothetical protein
MKRLCILHIGTTKTGTTSIQNSLDLNRKILKAANYKMLSNKLREGNSDYLFAISQCKNIENKKQIENNYKELIEKEEKNILVTSEQFSALGMFNPEIFENTFNFFKNYEFDISVVLYLRNQKNWILSDYIQDVKGGGIHSLEDFLTGSLEDPDKYDIYKLVKNVKSENIKLKIKPYKKDIYENWNILRDFYSLIPVKNLSLYKILNMNTLTVEDKNILRPSKQGIEDILKFNKNYRNFIQKQENYTNKLNDAFQKVLEALSDRHKESESLLIDNDISKRIENLYWDGNKKLIEEYPYLEKYLTF